MATTRSITPGSSTKADYRVLRSPLSDDEIWKRLKRAGFDEHSIQHKDKAAIVSYFAKLEAQIYDHQHHMGLLILERKELASKYEEVKALVDSSEFMHKHDSAMNIPTMNEARKREESLKKAVGVKEACIASSFFLAEAEAKLHAAKALQGKVNQHNSDADRKLRDVEAREDDLRRKIISFKSDCDEKEKEIILERQCLSERQKGLQQE